MKKTLLILMVGLLVGCNRYEVDGDTVYWHTTNSGNFYDKRVVEGADAKTFKAFEEFYRYGKDKNNAYFDGVAIDAEVDTQSFKPIAEYYAVDKNHAYISRDLIKTSDGQSFEIIKGNWSKDKNEIFYRTSPIGVCHMGSFVITEIDYDWIAFDKECAYYQGKKIPFKDRDSLVLYKGGFSKDEFGVYYADKVVEGADPETFKMIGTSVIAQDKNGCYETPGVKMDKCPPIYYDKEFNK